ncbi:MDIS1-interacting receptor like kinase 2-like [Helianthus annuus]|uniref:MDIS1-interacting receptor like kinase 2-like n=1 Tax=Helianthus annuus TaxID=4232 RepID=UPI00165332BF|nr:MDIS1-interacting receptor like kinase 2-like [Helianthus annuus]
MKVTEKCDVYSFGVLVLEIIKGEHPGDIISSLASTSTEEVEFTDLVDHRLPVPLPEIKEVLTSILILAIRCINSNPEIRPTMHQVSNNIAVPNTNKQTNNKGGPPLETVATVGTSTLKTGRVGGRGGRDGAVAGAGGGRTVLLVHTVQPKSDNAV